MADRAPKGTPRLNGHCLDGWRNTYDQDGVANARPGTASLATSHLGLPNEPPFSGERPSKAQERVRCNGMLDGDTALDHLSDVLDQRA
jgi:hypothetical protein